MEEIMQSNSYFILPLSLAYLAICGGWFLLDRLGYSWDVPSIQSPQKPWLDFTLGMTASIAILAIGQVYSAGYLIPPSQNIWIKYIVWPINNLIIFSPIFMLLLIRNQHLHTVFISLHHLPRKLLFGLIASFIGISIFLSLRGEWSRWSEIAHHSIQPETLSNFPAIFLENVSIAFLFIRLKWFAGIKLAILIPSLLFAFAHVPGSIAEGDPWAHILTFFFVTGSLTMVILYTAYRSRDIIWLGVVHYVMDVAIKAF